MQAAIQYWVNKFRREDGQTMAEYGVVLGVIALGVAVALGFRSDAINSVILSDLACGSHGMDRRAVIR